MRYEVRKIVAVSLAVAAVCSPAFVGASMAQAQGGPGLGVTPLPEMPGKPVILPDQSGAAAPAASLQGLVPSNGASKPGSVPVPMRSSTQAPMAQPIAGAGTPASTQ